MYFIGRGRHRYRNRRRYRYRYVYRCRQRRVRTHAMCGRRLFIKRRRVREAATADCQQMAAITYQWLPQVYAPTGPPLSAPARRTQQAFKLSWQADKARAKACRSRSWRRRRRRGGAKKEKAPTIRRILVFCSRFAGHIKNIFNLTAANVFTPCCHMLNGQTGWGRQGRGNGGIFCCCCINTLPTVASCLRKLSTWRRGINSISKVFSKLPQQRRGKAIGDVCADPRQQAQALAHSQAEADSVSDSGSGFMHTLTHVTRVLALVLVFVFC